MTAGLSKLATALIVIFTISLVTLVAELSYVLWRRRLSRRRSQCVPTSPSDNATQTSPDTTSFSSISSKRLLYFFCLNSKDFSRVQPKSVPIPNLNSTVSSPPDDEMEVIDVFKLQNMYGPSRILFTIAEEDKEVDLESDKSNSVSSSADKGTERRSKRISLLDDRFNLKLDDRETPPEVKMDVADEIEITPFSTPCGSPLYFTPTASPTRDSREK